MILYLIDINQSLSITSHDIFIIYLLILEINALFYNIIFFHNKLFCFRQKRAICIFMLFKIIWIVHKIQLQNTNCIQYHTVYYTFTLL